MIKVIAFDLFGTVFDMANADKEALRHYGSVLKNYQQNGVWMPLEFPECWEWLPAFEDSEAGIDWLKSNYKVVSMSNCPIKLQLKLCKNRYIDFNWMMPLELIEVYKPDLSTYRTLIHVLGVQPEEVMMVTANEHFGDIEAAKRLGMVPQLIRGNSDVQTILKLAEKMNDL